MALFGTADPNDTFNRSRNVRLDAIAVEPAALELAATCKIAELYAFQPPAEWKAGPLIGECCRAFFSSFKIWNEATLGGNIVMSLPAGPMISLTVALEATYTLVGRATARRAEVRAADFVTGNHANVLGHGELLRSVRSRQRRWRNLSRSAVRS